MALSAPVTVPLSTGAFTITITGAFPSFYQPVVTTSWMTDWSATSITPTGFVLTFATPAPPGAMLQYSIFTGDSGPSGTVGAVTAGTIIDNVRDEIPDPVYSAQDETGVPLPDADGGLFRAQTLYRWLDAGVKALAQACGAIIEDWTAIPQVGAQPWYAMNPGFITVTDGFSNQWPLDIRSVPEGGTIWPSTSQARSQSFIGYFRKRSDHLEFGLWPIPELTDPASTLVGSIPSSGGTITVASALNFLSFGYVQIEAEIIQYQQLTGNVLSVLSRGVCGTSAAAHSSGAIVQHLGLWLKGSRNPAPVVNSNTVIELPVDLVHYCELYLLGRCRRSENEHAEGRAMLKEFYDKCKELRGDPTRKVSQGVLPAYGDAGLGPIYWQSGAGGVVVP